ncbi:7125_t:CDS:1, partial [Cetraspora pellucida]
NLKSQQLTNLLQEFVENISEQSDSGESLQAVDTNDKNSITPQLKNSKKHHRKRRPLGTKRFKSSHEGHGSKIKHQRRCKKCGNTGHYQKNCK